MTAANATTITTAINTFNNSAFAWDNAGAPDGKPVPNKSYWSKQAWTEIHTELKAVNTGWVLDQAFSAGEDPYWSSQNYDEVHEKCSGWSVLYGGYNYTQYGGSTCGHTIDHNEEVGVINPNNEPAIMGLGHGSDISKYEYYTIGNGLDTSLGTIDLSYVGTGKTTQSASDPDFSGGVTTDWKQNWKIPKVSDPKGKEFADALVVCLLYTSPSPRDS